MVIGQLHIPYSALGVAWGGQSAAIRANKQKDDFCLEGMLVLVLGIEERTIPLAAVSSLARSSPPFLTPLWELQFLLDSCAILLPSLLFLSFGSLLEPTRLVLSCIFLLGSLFCTVLYPSCLHNREKSWPTASSHPSSFLPPPRPPAPLYL